MIGQPIPGAGQVGLLSEVSLKRRRKQDKPAPARNAGRGHPQGFTVCSIRTRGGWGTRPIPHQL